MLTGPREEEEEEDEEEEEGGRRKKAVLKHNGTKHPSIPLANTDHIKES
jgi:hypothetical protein